MGQPLILDFDMGPQYRYFIEIIYLMKTEELQFKVNMRNNSWIALGFGESMFNTDMMGWHALGENSYTADYWATRNGTPGWDSNNDLNTTHVVEPDGRVTFTTTRKLDTGDNQDFAIKLEEPTKMLWAIRARDGRWKQHDWRWNFELTYKEEYGNLVLKDGIERPAVKLAVTDPVDSGVKRELTCLTQTWDVDFTLDSCIDIESNDLVLRATIPDGSWFAIGFGAKMPNTDMIGWHAENGVGITKDYWSDGYGTPREDASSDVRDESPPT